MPVNVTEVRHALVSLAKPSNLSIQVIEKAIGNSPNEEQHHITKFKVVKDTLTKNSKYFSKMLLSQFAEAKKDIVTLEDDSTIAMELLLRSLHGVDVDHLYEVPLKEVWHVIAAADKYQINLERLRAWFKVWYRLNGEKIELDDFNARELAYPCYIFNHAHGFARVTKWLAYNFAGHITEHNPTVYPHLHLAPHHFVGPMNASRGRLKTVLHSHLWADLGKLFRHHSCGCWHRTTAEYQAQLVHIRVWPLEEVYPKNSMNDLLDRLDSFNHRSAAPDCFACNIDWPARVEEARDQVSGYFDGLCLDCMDRTQPKRGNEDNDYWGHGISVEGRWDSDCRIRHGNPTWYSSWLGRSDTREKLLKLGREKKKKLHSSDFM
ncbi:hypothetical protein AOQ84DRAFT_290291 [Glonium stellatum]|uniref:BTB domain-containing protein n=1 Tax=Glonium stellatum TaxID=574774 RepID=A0A8E2JUS8_9PEZI|nr:hypothetical protein AOQ84DRAFT_290291 [Glonium stellatum]